MKIEKLSLNKVKVTVSPYDLSIWDISLEEMNPDSPFVHEFIRSLVRRAESEMGFDADCGRWVIEVMPQENEFIFLITRVNAASETQAVSEIRTESKIRGERERMRHKMQNRQFRVVKKAVSGQRTHECIYKFDTFEDFVAMLNIADDAEAFKKCKLYKLGGSYYLTAKVAITSGDTANEPNAAQAPNMALVSEFADRVDDKLFGAQLAEYGALVAANGDFVRIQESFGNVK